MPPKEVIDEVSLILTITGFKNKIEKLENLKKRRFNMKNIPDKNLLYLEAV